MSIRLLDDRVAVQREVADEKTPGGIVLPDIAKDKSCFALVVAIGPGKLIDSKTGEPWRHNMQVAVGDRVLLDKWAGTETDIDGKELLIIRESDILAVV